jgi:hypothetical protein
MKPPSDTDANHRKIMRSTPPPTAAVQPFRKILIANRGEIACRVAATARRLGIRTVAIYSDADAQARHVLACDEAVHVGASAPRESYLQWQRIIDAARATGAQAIHPGYGFLSENEDFAQACADAGLVFIGPPASAIRDMGSKAAAKALMEKAGVPLVPGYHGADNDPALLAREADRMGYPAAVARACAASTGPKTSPPPWPVVSVRPRRALATTMCWLSAMCCARVILRSRSLPTHMAMRCICLNVTARCSVGTKRF